MKLTRLRTMLFIAEVLIAVLGVVVPLVKEVLEAQKQQETAEQSKTSEA